MKRHPTSIRLTLVRKHGSSVVHGKYLDGTWCNQSGWKHKWEQFDAVPTKLAEGLRLCKKCFKAVSHD